MSLYPTLTESEFITFNQGIDQKVLKSNFEGLGKQQVKRKWLYPKRNLTINYSSINNAELRLLEKFYVDRYGGYSSFTFIMPATEISIYTSEYIGMGDGSTTAFNLPSKAATSISIYNDGSLITAGDTTTGDYYITADSGRDGVDLITFNEAPVDGNRITTDFTGPLAMRCRFTDTISYQRSRISIGLNDISVSLSGLLIDE